MFFKFNNLIFKALKICEFIRIKFIIQILMLKFMRIIPINLLYLGELNK